MKKLLFFLIILMPMMVTAQEVSPKDSLAAKEAEKKVLLAAQEAADKEDVVYKVVEQMPEFPGGDKALWTFLVENVKYPSVAKENGIYGRVICQFIVEKDGSISNVEAVKSSGERSLDNEAIRVIKMMPKWKPGRQQKEPVRVRYTLPINFSLDGKSRKEESYSYEMTPTKTAMPEVKQGNRKMGSFTDGDSFYVKREKNSKPILAPNGAIISPNIGFSNVFKGVKTNNKASVRMHEDTMIVTYEDVAKSQVIKIEHYLYHAESDALTIEGEQLYLHNNTPYCSEIIGNGQLKRVIWYDANGQKERIYIFKKGQSITEMQFYPSGKVSVQTDHFGTPNAAQKALHEDGSLGKLSAPSLAEGIEELDAYFNRKFRFNKLYSKEDFRLSVSVDSVGECSILVFEDDGTFLTRMDAKDALPWSAAKIDGKPIAFSFERRVTYNPKRYLQIGDTLPMYNMQSSYTTSHGVRWIDTRIYSFVSADTCSLCGTVTKNGDTLLVNCFDKKSGRKIALQKYIKNGEGKEIREGWFTYYKNNKKSYEELFVNDSVCRAIHYGENGNPQMQVVKVSANKSAVSDTMYYYYPEGGLKKKLFVSKKNKDVETYYDKQGNPTKAVVLPVYPGKAKALSKYIRENIQIKPNFGKNTGVNWVDCEADFYVEVDENGKILRVGKGASRVVQNFKNIPLSKTDTDYLFKQMEECIAQNPTLWKPGSIQGEHTSLFAVVHVKYTYTKQ